MALFLGTAGGTAPTTGAHERAPATATIPVRERCFATAKPPITDLRVRSDVGHRTGSELRSATNPESLTLILAASRRTSGTGSASSRARASPGPRALRTRHAVRPRLNEAIAEKPPPTTLPGLASTDPKFDDRHEATSCFIGVNAKNAEARYWEHDSRTPRRLSGLVLERRGPGHRPPAARYRAGTTQRCCG